MKSQYDLIHKPLITEKTTILSEQNKYVFQVATCASKPLIKKAVEAIFEVKATISLAAGETIDLYAF